MLIGVQRRVPAVPLLRSDALLGGRATFEQTDKLFIRGVDFDAKCVRAFALEPFSPVRAFLRKQLKRLPELRERRSKVPYRLLVEKRGIPALRITTGCTEENLDPNIPLPRTLFQLRSWRCANFQTRRQDATVNALKCELKASGGLALRNRCGTVLGAME